MACVSVNGPLGIADGEVETDATVWPAAIRTGNKASDASKVLVQHAPRKFTAKLHLSPILSSKFDTMISFGWRYASDVPTHQRELFFGLIRIHVLVHALHEPIFGLAMMEELKHHGYRIGPGTLYPLLHGLEGSGLLRSELKKVSGRRRRVYKITAEGRKALDRAKAKVDELHHELHEARPRKISDLQ
jgi:DNA-binding PadR family transcriptional regulator